MSKEFIEQQLKEKYAKVGCDVTRIKSFDERTIQYELTNRKTGKHIGMTTPKETIPVLNPKIMDIEQIFE